MIGQAINLGSPINRSHPLCRGITAWWKVLPGPFWGGNRLRDLTGAFHGDLTSGAAWSGGGFPGGHGSIFFDGSDDHVNVPYDARYDVGAGAFTVAVWVKLVASGEPACAIVDWETSSIVSGSGSGWVIDAEASSRPNFVIDDGTAANDAVHLGTGSLVGDGWHHLVGVVSASAVTGYRDGVLTQSIARTTGSLTHTNPLNIGQQQPFGRSINGFVHEVILWNGRALSDTDVAALYNASFRDGNPMLSYVRRPVRVNTVGGGGGGLDIPIAAYHYNHHLSSMAG